jgi:hypothetical protein
VTTYVEVKPHSSMKNSVNSMLLVDEIFSLLNVTVR